MTSRIASFKTIKPSLATLLVAMASLNAQAAGPVPAAPDAGSILQQTQPISPPVPSPTGTGLTIEQPRGAALPASAPFLVKSLRLSGNTLFDTPTLHALVANAEGQNISLAQLSELTARITAYYFDHGYVLARALIPAQVIRDGVVDIQIVEARYGRITIDNGSRVDDSLLQETIALLRGGEIVSQPEMDRALLLLSDIPGVAVNALLKPGESVGTTDLSITAAPGPAIAGSAVLDNYGNPHTGRVRAGVAASIVNPLLHHGDLLNLHALTSGGGMDYGRIAYESLLSSAGTRLGGSYSSLRYALGESFAALDAHGTAAMTSLWARHPFVRSRNANLYGQIQFDRTVLRDRIDASALQTDRHTQAITTSLSGDARDTLLSGGVTAWSLGLTAGRLDFDNGAAQLSDAATAKTQGSFSKLNAAVSRVQNLDSDITLHLALSYQWTNDNLDSSQKMVGGGPYSVRAYDVGTLSGDRGYLGTVELRRNLGPLWLRQWQAIFFVDSAHMKINQNPWDAGTNTATLNGIGAGLAWAGPDQWSGRAYVAAPFGSKPSFTGKPPSARGWVEASKKF